MPRSLLEQVEERSPWLATAMAEADLYVRLADRYASMLDRSWAARTGSSLSMPLRDRVMSLTLVAASFWHEAFREPDSLQTLRLGQSMAAFFPEPVTYSPYTMFDPVKVMAMSDSEFERVMRYWRVQYYVHHARGPERHTCLD